MESTVQLNARMSRSLKQSGDEALALIGLSPTQAVRALWEKASRRGKDLEEVKELLCSEDSGESPARTQTDKALVEGRAIVEQFYAKLGIDYSELKRPEDMPSDKELLEEALYERMVERGLA